MSLVEAEALASLVEFLLEPPWTRDGITSAAGRSPNVRLLDNGPMVDADTGLNRAYWVLLSMLSPLSANSFAEFYPLVRNILISDFRVDDEDASDPARTIAKYLWLEHQSRSRRTRQVIDSEMRDELLDLSAGRCWYCGAPFGQEAIGRFLRTSGGEAEHGLELPLYVDFVTGRGRQVRDLHIEIDHVSPFSRLGKDVMENLRLACGWCNGHKGARSLIFDVPATPLGYRHPRLGEVLLPQPFWVVRCLGTRRKCHVAACSEGVDQAQLWVAPIRRSGAMVPGNLGAYCDEHDPLREYRLVPASRRSLVVAGPLR